MRNTLNVIFVMIITIGLFGSIGIVFADRFIDAYDFPDKSLLEGSEKPKLKDVIDASFQTGEMQKAAETYIASRVPFYDDLIIMQAANQRLSIHLSAFVSGFDVVPTYFGSHYIEVLSEKRLSSRPMKRPESTKSLDVFESEIKRISEQNKNMRISVMWILEDRQSRLNPAYSLKHGAHLDEEYVLEHNMLPLIGSVPVHMTSVYDSEINTPVFPSDGHWTLQRALDCYNIVAKDLGIETVDWDALQTRITVENWYGNEGRNGRILDYPNTTVDDINPFSNLEYLKIKSDKPIKLTDKGLRELALDDALDDDQRNVLKYSGYSRYYGQGNVRIVNHGKNNGKTLLILGDSYTYCLKRYFANNYQTTYYMLPGNHTTSDSFEDIVKEYGIDDIAIMMQVNKPDVIASKSPKFLGYAYTGELDEEAM